MPAKQLEPRVPCSDRSRFSRTGLRGYAAASLLVLSLGLGLRVVQFGANPSLWLDELKLAFAVEYSSWFGLLSGELSYDQVAPIGFVLLEKAISLVAGRSDLALRIVPFAASLLGLVVFGRLVWRLIARPWALVALACFAFSPFLISLSGILKQYSTDAFISAALTLVILRTRQAGAAMSVATLAVVAGLAVLLSTPAVLICAAGAAGLSWDLYRNRALGRRQVAVVLSLLIVPGLLAVYAKAGVPAATREFMDAYWFGAFMPPLSEYPTWLLDRLRFILPRLFLRPYMPGELAYPAGVNVSVALAVSLTSLAGTAFLLKTKPWLAILIAGPVLAALLASRVGAYPVHDRTWTFLLPQLVILVVLGLQWMTSVAPRSRRGAAGICLAISILPLIAARPPYAVSRQKEVLATVTDNLRPGDRVWAYRSQLALQFYGPKYGISEFTPSRCWVGTARQQLREVDQFRGIARLWVVLGHIDSRSAAELDVVLEYLNAIGTQKREFHAVSPGQLKYAAFLFDLSDTTRLAAADASSFPVGQSIPVSERQSCW